MIKKTLFTTWLAFMCVGLSNARPVTMINGEPLVNNADRFEFDGDRISVTFSEGYTYMYDLEEVEVIFTEQSSSSAAPTSFLRLNTVVKDVIHLDGVNVGNALRIVDVDGQTLYASEAVSENVVINLASFAKGIYILTIGGQSVKLIKE